MRRTRLTAIAALLVSSALLAGCTGALPSPDPEPAPSIAQPVLTPGQVERAAQRISLALDQADLARDAAMLPGVLNGPAAQIRAAQYIAAEDAGDDALTVLPPALQTSVISTTEQWPRSLFVVTEQPENLEPQRLVVLRQASARENYQMWGWVRLFPGAELPAFDQSTTGSAEVTDSSGLSADITETLDQYVDVLNNGTDSSFAGAFGADVLRQTIEARRAELGEALTPIEGDYRYQVTRPEGADGAPIAWRTADGGALVVAALTATERARGPQGASIRPDDVTRALLGDTKVSNRLFVDRQIVVALAIPPTGSTDEISVVGAENVRIAARTSN